MTIVGSPLRSMTSLALNVGQVSNVEPKLVLIWILHSYWITSMVPEITVNTIGGEKQSPVLPGTNAAIYNNNCLGKTVSLLDVCLLETN